MSNIYIQEPPTVGKVLLITTVGDIDIELWSRECPKACRNFVQRCIEGYYDKTIFHRIVKGFIAQGGDPTGTGCGGDSIYGEPFRDEFHSRLRFSRRGLVAMANGGRDDNGTQFFFTFAPCPELQNKNTIFGKVAGDTLFNMLKLEEAQVDQNQRPLYPPQIIKTRVLNNPFSDMFPRKHLRPKPQKEEKEKKSGTKNFKLLSFGEEAEEDEVAADQIAKKYSGKSKSSHDLSNDPNLSSTPAVHEGKGAVSVELSGDMAEDAVTEENCLQKVKEKLRSRSKIDEKDKKKKMSDEIENTPINVEFDEQPPFQTEKELKLKKLREEFKQLKRDFKESNKVKEDTPENSESEISDTDNEILLSYKQELSKYKKVKKQQISKGSEREYKTLELLEKFQSKIDKIREEAEGEQKEEADLDFDEEDDDIPAELLFTHKLTFQSAEPVLAKDANTKDDDWFEIYDPRNPLNKRRRGEDQQPKPKRRREENSS